MSGNGTQDDEHLDILLCLDDPDLEAPITEAGARVLAQWTWHRGSDPRAVTAVLALIEPLFSPHDLRHRRGSLWHLAGVPPVQAAAWLGHSVQEHLRTYAHVMLDRTELDYAAMLTSRTRIGATSSVRPTAHGISRGS